MTWINNLKLKSKFTILVIVPLIGLVFLLGESLIFTDSVRDQTTALTTSESQTIADLNDLFVQALIGGQATRNILLNTSDEIAKKNYINAKKDFYKSLDNVYLVQKDNAEFLEIVDNIKELANSVFSKNEYVQEVALNGDLQGSIEYMNSTVTPEWRRLKAKLFEATKHQGESYSNSRDVILEEISSFLFSSFIVGLTIIAMTIFLGFLGSKSILKPVLSLKKSALRIANGDTNFELKIRGTDEIGELRIAFNQMINTINDANQKLVIEKQGVEKRVEDAISEAVEKQKYLEDNTKVILDAMEKFSYGDLTQQLNAKNNDEMGKLFAGFNRAVQNIGKLISSVSESVQATASASAQISASTEEMAAGSQEQSAQTSEVATAIDEMSRTIYDSAKNTSTAAENAKNSGQIANQGGKVVNDTLTEMNKISDIVKSSAEKVHILGQNSEKIGEIISVISDIADQTNLLALNAAIEAARAGEQGRGFAVVADEVRKLAERTTNATKEISVMIKQIQVDTEEAVISMNKGVQQVENGKLLASQAGDVLSEIVYSSQKVTDIIVQVAATSEEQSSSAEEISRSIEGINNVTQETTMGIQQIAKASEDLSQLTSRLQELISQFHLTESRHGYKQLR